MRLSFHCHANTYPRLACFFSTVFISMLSCFFRPFCRLVNLPSADLRLLVNLLSVPIVLNIRRTKVRLLSGIFLSYGTFAVRGYRH